MKRHMHVNNRKLVGAIWLLINMINSCSKQHRTVQGATKIGILKPLAPMNHNSSKSEHTDMMQIFLFLVILKFPVYIILHIKKNKPD